MALEVSTGEMARWLSGSEPPTHEAFLRAVDIILAHDGQLPWTSAELLAELPPEFRKPK